jgi:hypothetical protein
MVQFAEQEIQIEFDVVVTEFEKLLSINFVFTCTVSTARAKKIDRFHYFA